MINIQYLASSSSFVSFSSQENSRTSSLVTLAPVNVTYLTKLTRASNGESVIKCSLTQYVLVAIVALNIIHAVVVLPIMADMYYTGSFFSNSMWGICICRLYVSSHRSGQILRLNLRRFLS